MSFIILALGLNKCDQAAEASTEAIDYCVTSNWENLRDSGAVAVLPLPRSVIYIRKWKWMATNLGNYNNILRIHLPDYGQKEKKAEVLSAFISPKIWIYEFYFWRSHVTPKKTVKKQVCIMEKVWRDQVYLTILQTDFNWIISLYSLQLQSSLIEFCIFGGSSSWFWLWILGTFRVPPPIKRVILVW